MKSIYITANIRLSTALKQKFAQQQTQLVSQTPEIMTLSQWWTLWQEGCLLRGELDLKLLPTKILNSFESQWLWEQVLEETLSHQDEHQSIPAEEYLVNSELSQRERQSIALLNISSTAKQLYQAWLLSQNWFAEDWLETPFYSEEVSLYKQCQARYLQKLKSHGWQDEVLAQKQHLGYLISGKGQLPANFELHGFDEITPQIKRWKTAVEARSVTVTVIPNVVASVGKGGLNQQGLCVAQDTQQEVEQAVLWSILQWQRLSQVTPLAQIKIAIVSPNLADYKVALTQCLDEQLSLQGLQKLGSLRNQPPFYNLSLGTSLLQLPLVQSAWLSLKLFLQPKKPCTYSDWSQWLISPYTQGDLVQRQRADSSFRRLQWVTFTWPKLLGFELDSKSHFPTLPKVLESALVKQSLVELPRKLSLNKFIIAVWTLLETLSWPGDRTLNSDEYQQKMGFESVIIQFSMVTELAGEQTVSAWLTLLKYFLSEQLHQSESKGLQPIQIMGMLEAGGQTFDGLWVMGLTDEAWPRVSNPNPFLPIGLQKEHRVPRCDAMRELDYAKQITLRLRDSAPHVVWSYAQYKEDAEHLLSPLIEQVLQMNTLDVSLTKAINLSVKKRTEDYLIQPYQGLALSIFKQKKPLEWLEDAQGPEVEPSTKALGGTGILQAQSQCPLMAFMDFRLGAKYGLQTVEEGLQNNNQGILIHRVLELFWQETKTQVAMLTLSDNELVEQLKRHINHSFENLKGTVENAYIELEQNRILDLCLEWLALDKIRPSFTVVETETKHEIILAGIEFSVVIDRIDEVFGSKIIVDYKTGKVSINQLLKTPTKAPQLAVYLYAVSKNIAGIGYGLLHSDEGVCMSAIVENEEVLHKARSIQVFAKIAEKKTNNYYETTWQDFLEHLRLQVQTLAEAIQQGIAPMAFDKESDIKYAHCKLALRLPEAREQRQHQKQVHQQDNQVQQKQSGGQ